MKDIHQIVRDIINLFEHVEENYCKTVKVGNCLE